MRSNCHRVIMCNKLATIETIIENEPRIPPEAADFSLKNDCVGRVVLRCFVFLMCCVALPSLSKHLLERLIIPNGDAIYNTIQCNSS